VLWRRQADVFHLEAWRSFAPYVVGLLTEIATGYEFS
jgi:sarcosine oxidase, subunit gamma